MTRPRLLPLLVASLVLAVLPGGSAAPEAQSARTFLAVALHDVVDDRAQLDGDSTTTSDLVAFFEYLVSNGWHALTLDEVDRAGRGETTLPEKSILITIDDGYASDYTRIYPLLLANKMPAVFALPAAWIERGHGPDGEAVLTWAQAREMQRSGLVEFASHSYDLHGTVQGNPQASQVPAFWARIFDPARGYEDDDAYRHRVAADLRQSVAVMTRELGRAPRAVAWPYGRYTQSVVEIAESLGFRFALTFDPEPALASRPLALARFALSSGTLLSGLVGRLQAGDTLPRVRRFVRLRPSALWRPDPAETERLLGAAIERVRILGATAIVIDAVEPGPDGRPDCVVPDESDTRPRRRLPAVRVAISDSSGCAGVGASACGRARYRRRRARGHLPRLRHLYLRGRSAGRRGQRAGGTRRRRLRRAVGSRRRAARHRHGPVAAAGATSHDLLQGRATRAAWSAARLDLDESS